MWPHQKRSELDRPLVRSRITAFIQSTILTTTRYHPVNKSGAEVRLTPVKEIILKLLIACHIPHCLLSEHPTIKQPENTTNSLKRDSAYPKRACGHLVTNMSYGTKISKIFKSACETPLQLDSCLYREISTVIIIKKKI